jgi:hypothetical protein
VKTSDRGELQAKPEKFREPERSSRWPDGSCSIYDHSSRFPFLTSAVNCLRRSLPTKYMENTNPANLVRKDDRPQVVFPENTNGEVAAFEESSINLFCFPWSSNRLPAAFPNFSKAVREAIR